jgi:hypothetical protein
MPVRREYQTQTVAEGRAQADRLRPLNIVRRPASPRIVCPDPTAAQMDRLARVRSAYGSEQDGIERIKGVIYPDGLMIIESRIYKTGKPWRRVAVKRDGKVFRTATRHDQGYGYRGGSWTVVRGLTGRKPLAKRNLPERIATGLLRGLITVEEAAERGWDY